MKRIAFFIILKRLSVAKNCLRPVSVPLKFFRSALFNVKTRVSLKYLANDHRN